MAELPLDDILHQTSANITPLNPTSEEIQQAFEQIEQKLPFRYEEALGELLTFTGNLNDPIHRWFFYKESFSPRLVETILERYPAPPYYPAILDPFCGAGTTLMTAQSRSIPAVGIELNPFAAFLSRVKVERCLIDCDQFKTSLEWAIHRSFPTSVHLPELTTFHNEKYFPNNHAYELIQLRDTIWRIRTTPAIKNALLLALAATLEDVSCLRRDGRMLRYKQRTVISPKEALQHRAKAMLEDLQGSLTQLRPQVKVLDGDARELLSILLANNHRRKFGLIIYSPPYPNNFDYSEVYKCELWLVGFISSYREWLQLRRRTLRSHPSCNFPSTSYLRDSSTCRDIYRLVEQAARCTDIGGYAQKCAPKVIRGYFDDLFQSLQQQINRLAYGGYIICVVGNSQHGNLHIPADTLIAKIGQGLGLELVEICVAKLRMSRNQQGRKLRESLVVFRKSRQ